jgi:hypothetical protein
MDRKEFFGAVPFAAMMGLPAEPWPGRVLSAVEERFIGVYTLISSGGSGESPIGRIYYDRAGRMGAMLHPRERTPLPESPTVEDYRAMLRGLVAYFGTYTIDESTTRVIHHMESALDPAEVGAERVRWYQFVGDNRLALYTREGFSGTPLVWERLPAG